MEKKSFEIIIFRVGFWIRLRSYRQFLYILSGRKFARNKATNFFYYLPWINVDELEEN